MRSAVLLARQVALAAEIHRRCRPLARKELARWRESAQAICDPDLRCQALASIDRKAFHCEGGAVYGAAAPGRAGTLVPAIVALQTLVDYLDNLSDRCGHVSEETLRRLHFAVGDALTPGAPVRDYANQRDGGYLASLVKASQSRLQELPGYPAVEQHCRELGSHYSELQVLKHLPDRAARGPALAAWLAPLEQKHAGWRWWELAAACGSTLGVFALLAAAAGDRNPTAGPTLAAYFPWVCGLHILLDYYIDQEEDARGGDFNFIWSYGSHSEATRALARIHLEARRRVEALNDPALHLMVVQGLPGIYLSDPKVNRQGFSHGARRILLQGGPLTLGAYLYCRASPPLR